MGLKGGACLFGDEFVQNGHDKVKKTRIGLEGLEHLVTSQ